jgi:hypothetical protein
LLKKYLRGRGELTSDIDMNEFVYVYPIQNEEFLKRISHSTNYLYFLFVASAKQNRLANIKVSQKRILTYH